MSANEHLLWGKCWKIIRETGRLTVRADDKFTPDEAEALASVLLRMAATERKEPTR